MPGISFDQPLFSANAGVTTDWGSAKGSALVQMPVDLQLNRGASFELGLVGQLRGEAAFQKYIAAQITGQVGAQARIQGQIQMPMNLFREVGFAVRLQAILEAAAGIEAGIGISVGDFIDLAQSQLQMRGLPLQLFSIFMEEVDIGASLSAKAAFTAQAYANLVCTGRLVGDATEDPGFKFAFGYGYGYKGGYGMRIAARAGLKDVSRLVARSVDVIVDETIDAIALKMDPDQTTELALLDASRPICKMAGRIAYEAGEYMVKNNTPLNNDGAQKVALRVVQVILEEMQRGLLRALIDDALQQFETWIEAEISKMDGGTFAALAPQREALASHLRAMPKEAFDLRDSAALDYWNGLSILMINTAVAFSEQTTPLSAQDTKLLSQIWAATQLMFAVTVKMVRADASVSVIGLPPAQAKAAFEGPLSAQPHDLVRTAISTVVGDATGTTPSGDLTQQDLLIFLLEGGALDALMDVSPSMKALLEPFEGSGLGSTKRDVARLVMTSMGAVMTNASGELDAQLSLQELAEGLRLFAHDKIEDIVAPAARAAVPPHQAEVLMYLDEILLPSLRMVVDTGFTDILGWANGTVNQTALEEALSSVLMAIFGRSVIVTGDILMAFTQDNFSGLLARMADEPGTPGDPDALVNIPGGFCEAAAEIIDPALPLNATQITDEMRAFLVIASEVAKPFPPDVRARMRQLMFDVIAPIPTSASDAFLNDLKNDLWIPNDGALLALGEEMMGQVGERLSEFVMRLLAHAGEIAGEALNDVLNTGAAAFNAFVVGLAQALSIAAERLGELAGEIAEKLAELAGFAAQVAEDLLQLVPALTGRLEAFIDSVAERMQINALPLLTSALPYQAVPTQFRTAAQATLQRTLRNMVSGVLAAPMGSIISSLTDDAETLSQDLLSLDPSIGMVNGVKEIILDRLNDVVPPTGITVPIAFDFSWTITVPVFEVSFQHPAGRWVSRDISQTVSFDLGQITIPTGVLNDLIASHLLAGAPVENALELLADTLHDHLATMLSLQALQDENATLSQAQIRMRRQQSRFDAAVTGIEILSPGLVATSPTQLRIAIYGVDADFVADDQDLPDRLTVFLNDQRIPMHHFGISRLPPAHAKSLLPKVGIVITLNDAGPISEGINTLTVSALNGSGPEHRVTQAFIVEDDTNKTMPTKRGPKDRPIPTINTPGKVRNPPTAKPTAGIGKGSVTTIVRNAQKQPAKLTPDPIVAVASLSAKTDAHARKRFGDRSTSDAPPSRPILTRNPRQTETRGDTK